MAVYSQTYELIRRIQEKAAETGRRVGEYERSHYRGS